MAEDVDRWLGNLDGAAAHDRRNGACRRNRAILTDFVPGLSTRKVGETLLSLLGRPVAPTTVSR